MVLTLLFSFFFLLALVILSFCGQALPLNASLGYQALPLNVSSWQELYHAD
jgi:hypothetical protein